MPDWFGHDLSLFNGFDVDRFELIALILAIGMVLFAGAGKVGEKFSDILKPNNLKLSAGFGLRYLLSQKEKLNLRIDAGFGKNSQGTYLNMGEAF